MIGTDCLQPRLSAIPAYVPVTLDVAKGFKYGTDADFQRFGKELQNAVQCFDKMPLTLCHGKLIHTHRNIVCGLSWMCNYVTRNWVSAHGSEKKLELWDYRAEKISLTISSVVWIQYTNVTVTDRLTDGQTDTGREQRPRLRMASRG